mgnify:CR=1 FL=1
MSMRIATALLAFLFLLSLAACSSGTQDNAGSGDTAPLSAGESPGRKVPARKVPARGSWTAAEVIRKRLKRSCQMRKRHRRH